MWLLYYLIAISLMGFVLMGFDKWKSKAGLWRISERTLLFVALAGGSAGIYLGLKIFHHKTKHFKFKVIVPILLLLQIILSLVYFKIQH